MFANLVPLFRGIPPRELAMKTASAIRIGLGTLSVVVLTFPAFFYGYNRGYEKAREDLFAVGYIKAETPNTPRVKKRLPFIIDEPQAQNDAQP